MLQTPCRGLWHLLHNQLKGNDDALLALHLVPRAGAGVLAELEVAEAHAEDAPGFFVQLREDLIVVRPAARRFQRLVPRALRLLGWFFGLLCFSSAQAVKSPLGPK